MEEKEFRKKLSELETVNDQLQAEIRFLNELLCEVGFEGGIETLKSAAQELIEIEKRGEEI